MSGIVSYVIRSCTALCQVFEGYVDDARNTDNSWVEVTVLALELDRTGPLMTSINLMVSNPVLN